MRDRAASGATKREVWNVCRCDRHCGVSHRDVQSWLSIPHRFGSRGETLADNFGSIERPRRALCAPLFHVRASFLMRQIAFAFYLYSVPGWEFLRPCSFGAGDRLRREAYWGSDLQTWSEVAGRAAAPRSVGPVGDDGRIVLVNTRVTEREVSIAVTELSQSSRAGVESGISVDRPCVSNGEGSNDRGPRTSIRLRTMGSRTHGVRCAIQISECGKWI